LLFYHSTITFLHILIDNFSRFIISYKTALFLSGAICMNMIRDAYRKYLKPTLFKTTIGAQLMLSTAQQKESETLLICDGGPENNNKHVDGFLEQTIIPVRKLIAQKDIKFSNSLVEAFNKTLKYRHLFQHDITDFESLNKHLDKFIPEYNNIRPHCAHKYLTPAQAYFGQAVDLKKIKKQYEKARKNRLLENKKVICPVCST
jgi:putative transposase